MCCSIPRLAKSACDWSGIRQAFGLSWRMTGIGFTAGTRQRGEGLKNMAARAATLHAEVTISSGSGRGTHVVFELPVEVHA
jgi:glucose-6-phosphate-specific signal transduction histidine kinase